jgi:hypothetical protein
MTVDLSFQARTETALTLGLTAAAGTGSIEIQYGSRDDFQFCIAPIIGIGAPAASFQLAALNRAQTYWIRGREVNGDVRGDWNAAKAFTTAPGVPNLPDYAIQIAPAWLVVPRKPSRWYGAYTVAGYSVENLGRPSPAAAWRSVFTDNQILFYVETDGGGIDTVALLDTNLPEGAQMRLIAGPTLASMTGGSAPAFTSEFKNFRASENVPGRRGYHGIIRLAAPIEHRFVGVQIIGAMPPAGLVHVTHAVFGRARVLKNYGDMTDQPFDMSTSERMRDGSPDAVAGFRGRKVDFEIAAMTEAQHEAAFADVAQRVGTSEPVLILPNSKAGAYLHDRLLFGNLTANRQTNSNARFTRALSIDSIIN